MAPTIGESPLIVQDSEGRKYELKALVEAPSSPPADAPGFRVLSKGMGALRIIYGPASVSIVDREGDLITGPALKTLLPGILLRKRFSLGHIDILPGEILEKFATPDGSEYRTEVRTVTKDDMSRFDWLEKNGVQEGDDALFAVGRVYAKDLDGDGAGTFCDNVWDQVQKGALNAFSISGKAKAESKKVHCERGGFACKLVNEITEMEGSAITLCKIGMNQGAGFVVLTKSADKLRLDGFVIKIDDCGCGCGGACGGEEPHMHEHEDAERQDLEAIASAIQDLEDRHELDVLKGELASIEKAWTPFTTEAGTQGAQDEHGNKKYGDEARRLLQGSGQRAADAVDTARAHGSMEGATDIDNRARSRGLVQQRQQQYREGGDKNIDAMRRLSENAQASQDPREWPGGKPFVTPESAPIVNTVAQELANRGEGPVGEALRGNDMVNTVRETQGAIRDTEAHHGRDSPQSTAAVHEAAVRQQRAHEGRIPRTPAQVGVDERAARPDYQPKPGAISEGIHGPDVLDPAGNMKPAAGPALGSAARNEALAVESQFPQAGVESRMLGHGIEQARRLNQANARMAPNEAAVGGEPRGQHHTSREALNEAVEAGRPGFFARQELEPGEEAGWYAPGEGEAQRARTQKRPLAGDYTDPRNLKSADIRSLEAEFATLTKGTITDIEDAEEVEFPIVYPAHPTHIDVNMAHADSMATKKPADKVLDLARYPMGSDRMEDAAVGDTPRGVPPRGFVEEEPLKAIQKALADGASNMAGNEQAVMGKDVEGPMGGPDSGAGYMAKDPEADEKEGALAHQFTPKAKAAAIAALKAKADSPRAPKPVLDVTPLRAKAYADVRVEPGTIMKPGPAYEHSQSFERCLADVKSQAPPGRDPDEYAHRICYSSVGKSAFLKEYVPTCRGCRSVLKTLGPQHEAANYFDVALKAALTGRATFHGMRTQHVALLKADLPVLQRLLTKASEATRTQVVP